jgi:hypothetical protein
MIQKPQSSAEVTPEMIQEWKSKYGHVQKIEIAVGESETEVAVFFVRKPTVMEMQAVTKIAASKKDGGAIRASDMLRNKLVLGGDMKYLNPEQDADIHIALQEEIGELVGQKKAISTKL